MDLKKKSLDAFKSIGKKLNDPQGLTWAIVKGCGFGIAHLLRLFYNKVWR